MKRWRVLLGVLAASLVLPALGVAQRLSEEYGYDRVGDDYNSFETDSLEGCQAACRKDDRCRAYTYLSRKEECYLKKRVNPAQRSKDAVTGVKESRDDGRDDGLTEERGYDRRGNDYTSFRARELSECKRACGRERRCQAYTFDTRNGDCYLKDKVNRGERNGIMVTGYKASGGGRPYPDGGGGRGRLTEEEGLDRRGDDYDSFRVRELSDCKRECRDSSRCQAYTFIYSSRTCYLKSRINKAQGNRDAVTGYKESY